MDPGGRVGDPRGRLGEMWTWVFARSALDVITGLVPVIPIASSAAFL
ncbi:hypothetical protein [Microvirga makkahensis]|uniref:Uncharacterized protein n=1 Tax=Microvirga makkahensis TaxID=1128670 RepID=A0A7X3MPG1_9HYPH|nr:hypothetical protein [Microvirga makkahensis]MXQ10763.1 hypothetical protein [Microvirga makkahensis]